MIWPFHKRHPEPMEQTPPELVTYRFVPQFDITPFEVADMLTHSLWHGPHITTRAEFEAIPDNIKRHLLLEKLS